MRKKNTSALWTAHLRNWLSKTTKLQTMKCIRIFFCLIHRSSSSWMSHQTMLFHPTVKLMFIKTTWPCQGISTTRMAMGWVSSTQSQTWQVLMAWFTRMLQSICLVSKDKLKTTSGLKWESCHKPRSDRNVTLRRSTSESHRVSKAWENHSRDHKTRLKASYLRCKV